MPSSSSTFVAGLTAAALATVGFLAFQASANVPDDLAEPRRGAPAKAAKAPGSMAPTALPDGSGVGERVVYALTADRVWLVGADGRVNRTFRVAPGSVDPPPGSYSVRSRSGAVTGTDGTPIEHVVRFAEVDEVAIGFSAALDGSLPEPDPRVQTGGIRETVADGDAMWAFATIGRRVEVVR
ncbi:MULTISPECIES: L,D-transpeptidase [unclassified Streptomyces]|uniref:L,D-transpeptidase n=1 Tax=unclassified Streptomyces TaxID=2593676 RepID=UPI000710CFAB|nr:MULTISPECIES: L,D-transpeptidase [unclassified Streptomyces]KRC95849.1 hypothetical protein ASE41_08990 [Streptomyces sp. Root264]